MEHRMEPRVAILITGIPRSFSKKLWLFLHDLPQRFDVFISFPSSYKNDKYFNKPIDINTLMMDKRIKTLLIDNEEPEIVEDLTQRERNTVIQWYRIKKLFCNIPEKYEIIVRCRPDICPMCTSDEFVSFLKTGIPDNTIYIPNGNDIFDNAYTTPEDLASCLNDQFAFGNRKSMEYYCNLYDTLQYTKPLISEKQLCTHLKEYTIIRFDFPYKLVLSDCFSIAICGDSGVGKTYISKIINDVLPYDKSSVFETDRYHKWEW